MAKNARRGGTNRHALQPGRGAREGRGVSGTRRGGTNRHALQLLTNLARAGEGISPLLILMHDFPDPDALASAWGLQHLVRAFGIDSRIVYGGVITRAENRAYRRVMVAHLGNVAGPEDVAHVADYLLTYERADWSLCRGRLRGTLHLSLRSDLPAAAAAAILRRVVAEPDNAGGHGGIAGGRIPVGADATEADWKAAERTAQERLARGLGLPASGEFRRVFD